MPSRLYYGVSLYDQVNPNSPLYYQQWFWKNKDPEGDFTPNQYRRINAGLIYNIQLYIEDNAAAEESDYDIIALMVYAMYLILFTAIQLPLVRLPNSIIKTFLLREDDLRFLPNPHRATPSLGFSDAPLAYTWYQVRQALYITLTVPISLIDMTLTFLAFPIISVKAAWNFFTESKVAREERKSRELAMLLKSHYENGLDSDCSTLPQMLARFNPQLRSEVLHEYFHVQQVESAIVELTQDFSEDQYLNVYRKFGSTSKSIFSEKAIPADILVKFMQEGEISLIDKRYNAYRLMEQKLTNEQKIKIFAHEDLMYKTLLTTLDEKIIELMMQYTGTKTLNTHIRSQGPLMSAIALSGHSVPGLDLPKPREILRKTTSIEMNGLSVHPLFIMLFQGKLKASDVFVSTEERKAYFNHSDKPLAKAILDVLKNQSDESHLAGSVALRSWLEGCNQEEIQQFLDLRNEDGENVLIVEAYENNLRNWKNVLLLYGIQVPDRLTENRDNARGVAGRQGIHEESIHFTVTESLVAVDQWLNVKRPDAKHALAEFSAFVRNHRLPPEMTADISMSELPKSSDVVKRCFERLFKARASFESASKVSIEKMFVFFWARWKNMPTRNKAQISAKKAAWDVFCQQLVAIQRGYNDDKDETSADKPICFGGTYNQLTMAMQSVAPDLVWVDLMNDKLFMIKGMILLRESYLKKAIDKTDRGQYLQALRERFGSEDPADFFPTHLVEQLTEDEDFRNALADLCKNKVLGRQNVENTQEYVDMFLKHIKALKYNDLEVPEYSTKELSNVLDQIDGIFDTHVKAPTGATLGFAYRALRSNGSSLVTTDYERIKKEEALMRFSETLKDISVATVDKSFIKMTQDHDFMVQVHGLIQAREGKDNKKIYLKDTFDNNERAKAWMNHPNHFKDTLIALGLPTEYDDLDNFLYEHSIQLVSALFRAYYESKCFSYEREGVKEYQPYANAGSWVAI